MEKEKKPVSLVSGKKEGANEVRGSTIGLKSLTVEV
jgi:hypothetical protein